MSQQFKIADDYNTVAERISEFRMKFPDGSLQPADLARPFTIETVNGGQCFVVVAAAYRTADDTRPGIGMAYEPVPGATPFTRGSELQNAETAAWGRAIVAVLAADTKKGIASRDEVMNRRTDQQSSQSSGPDWNQLFTAAVGSREKLQALRNQGRRAGLPDDFGMFGAIETELQKLAQDEPIEGTIT